METPSLIPILVGPTGVGKTDIAYQIALELRAEILSADAYQVYQGLPVGTAQPSLEQMKRVPHHLIGVRNPSETWNAMLFAKEARTLIDKLQSAGRRLLIVGGSGFYVKALLEGIQDGGPPKPEDREKVKKQVEEKGREAAHQWLKELDPLSAERIHMNDTQRISRAIEKILYPVPVVESFEPLGADRVKVIGIERPREELDRLLKQRTRKMWEGGLLQETQWLMDQKIPMTAPIWGAIGYQEARSFIEGQMSLEEAVELIFRRTRQYAKRQWTWFKHQHSTQWVQSEAFKTEWRKIIS